MFGIRILSTILKRGSLKNWWYWLPILSMVLVYVFLFSKIENELNPDLVAYFSVAKHYQEGDFIEAFNSYWSPLICWLLALLPQLQSNPMGAFRLISMVVAFILFYQLFFWIRLVVYTSYARFLLCFLTMLIITEFSLSMGTPDFLSLACFFLFLKLLLRYRFAWKQSFWLAIAVLMCYFSKTFLLLLCFGTLFFYFIFLFYTKKRKIDIKPLFFLVVIIILGLFVWASCLKMHYGFYTLSSSASFNNSIAAEHIVSLQPPPFEKALFMWEDPYYIKVVSIYSLPNETIFQMVKNKIQRNFSITLYYFKFISFLGVGLLLIPFVGLFYKNARQGKISLLLLVVFFLNWLGYFLVFIMERYLIIGHIALCMAVVGFLEIISSKLSTKIISYKIPIVLSFFVFISFVKNPLHEIRYGFKVYQTVHTDIKQAKALADSGLLSGKKIATFQDTKNMYNVLSLACFQGGGKYYGEVYIGKPWEEQLKELNTFQLDYVAVYDCSLEKATCERKYWLEKYPVVYTDKLLNIKIYKLTL